MLPLPDINPALNDQQEDTVPPISPSWKRSSSYEQLQQIVPEEVNGHPKRALTLSMAGSETESMYGMSYVGCEGGSVVKHYWSFIQGQMKESPPHLSLK